MKAFFFLSLKVSWTSSTWHSLPQMHRLDMCVASISFPLSVILQILIRYFLCIRLVDACRFTVNEMNASSVFGRMVTTNRDCFVPSLLIASLVSPELLMAPPCPTSGLTWHSGTLQVYASHPGHWLHSPYPFPSFCSSAFNQDYERQIF